MERPGKNRLQKINFLIPVAPYPYLNADSAADENMERIMLKSKAHQKPSTFSPSNKRSASRMMQAFMTKRNRPERNYGNRQCEQNEKRFHNGIQKRKYKCEDDSCTDIINVNPVQDQREHIGNDTGKNKSGEKVHSNCFIYAKADKVFNLIR
jgi:hypothetical protein